MPVMHFEELARTANCRLTVPLNERRMLALL